MLKIIYFYIKPLLNILKSFADFAAGAIEKITFLDRLNKKWTNEDRSTRLVLEINFSAFLARCFSLG